MRWRIGLIMVLSSVCPAEILAAASAPAAEPLSLEVPVELWDRPRTGPAVLALPVVRQALNALGSRADARLAIRHGPGLEPAAQAEELRDWLIAHAVEPGRIAVLADASIRNALRLEIVSDRKP